MLLEKRIEAALVRDGYAPDSILAKRGEIRGIVFNHRPRGIALELRAAESLPIKKIRCKGGYQQRPVPQEDDLEWLTPPPCSWMVT